MRNSELTKGFNELSEAKKNNRLAMILVTVFAAVITITAMIMYMISHINIASKVKVVDISGRVIESDFVRQELLLESGIKSHVEYAVNYLNSFSREEIIDNQKKSLFLVDRENAHQIFESYKKSNAYDNATQRGHIYKVLNTKVTHLELSKGEPFYFKSQSLLEIKDGTRRTLYKIFSQGKITYRTPIYPNNTQGLWISEYRQTSKEVNKK